MYNLPKARNYQLFEAKPLSSADATGPVFGQLHFHKASMIWSADDKDDVERSWPIAYEMLEAATRTTAKIAAHDPEGSKKAWGVTPAQRWFGAWNGSRMRRVVRYFARAHRKMRRGWIICVRVNRNEFRARTGFGSRTIRFGNPFFKPGTLWSCPHPPPSNISLTSTLQNADTIVHEVIHTVGMTLIAPNEKYGNAALELARSAPQSAVRNAENYAGFATETYIDMAYGTKSDRWRKCLKAVYVIASTPP